jgi:hypothetical protein
VFEFVCDVRLQNVASNFSTVRRDSAQGARIYPANANEEYLEKLDEAESGRSDTTNTQQIDAAVDFLFNLEGDKAHLVPHAPVCDLAYTKIAQAATGQLGEAVCYWKRRKLVNGMKNRDKRLRDSGIKHSKYNKFHIHMRKQLLDCTPPALIIVPLLTLLEIKNWNSTPFDAMVLPCGARANYAASMVLRHVRDCCNENEIRNGIAILCDFVKDIAGSLVDVDPDVLKDLPTMGSGREPSLVRWKSLVNELRGHQQPTIQVPVLKDNLEWERVKVAKGTFDRDSSCLPDPFLLAVRGAINFSSHVGTKLMPSCPPEDSDSDSDSGGSY